MKNIVIIISVVLFSLICAPVSYANLQRSVETSDKTWTEGDKKIRVYEKTVYSKGQKTWYRKQTTTTPCYTEVVVDSVGKNGVPKNNYSYKEKGGKNCSSISSRTGRGRKGSNSTEDILLDVLEGVLRGKL